MSTNLEARYRALFETTLDAIVIVDDDGRYVDVNESMCRLLKTPREQLIGAHFRQFIPPELLESAASHFGALKTAGAFVGEFPLRAADGALVELDWSARADFVPGLHFCIARDITARKRAEKRLACEHAVARILAEATILAEAAPRILEAVCACIGAVAGDLWEEDAGAGVLRCTAAWARPPRVAGLAQFLEVSRRMTFPPGVGLPGRVWKERQTAAIAVLQEDTNFPRRQWAEAAGLASGVAFPLSAADEFCGVMEFFTTTPFEPDREFLELMTEIGHDIGQFIRRCRAERTLAAERERLRVTLASIGDGVIVTDVEGEVTFLNPVAERLTGWTQPEAAGRALADVFPILQEESRQPVESPVARVLREGVAVGLANHTLLIARDGTERSIDDSAAPICDDAGRTVGVVLIFRDVTEHRRAEEIRARLAAIVENSDVAIFSKDLDGIVTSWNRAAERLFGYSAAEMIGGSITRIIPPDRLDEFPIFMDRLRRGQRIEQYETERVRKNGERLQVLINLSPVRSPDGAITGASVMSRDITDRKALENELRQRVEDLAEADRRKDEFLAMLAHELRNPLAPIRNALHLLRFQGGDAAQVERLRAMMERQTAHLARLMDDLLDVSRISRGKIPLRRERLDLGRLVSVTLDQHHHSLEAAGLTAALVLPEAPVWVLGDATRLTQVLDNLLENAEKFTDRGGKVTVTLSVDPEETRAVLSVRDTGMGIESDMLPHLFDVFSQADRTLDRSRGGLGLGLALVKGLVELHQGTVEVRSAGAGKGAEFIIRLAREAEPSMLEPARTRTDREALGLRVLIIEDNPDAAESLRLLLEAYGCEAVTASSGTAGVEAARETRPDVVLCDVGLPLMNGYAVAEALRADAALHRTRLIALTGYGQEEHVRRAREAGFDAHLTKPADPERLIRYLRGE
jgi:PAS domain S-box-containing protein